MSAAYHDHGGTGNEEEKERGQHRRQRSRQTDGAGEARGKGRQSQGRQYRGKSAESQRSDRKAKGHEAVQEMRKDDGGAGEGRARADVYRVAIDGARKQFERAVDYCRMDLPRTAIDFAKRGIGILKLQALKHATRFIVECACCRKRRDCLVVASGRGPYSEAVCKWCMGHWEMGPCPLESKQVGKVKKTKRR